MEKYRITYISGGSVVTRPVTAEDVDHLRHNLIKKGYIKSSENVIGVINRDIGFLGSLSMDDYTDPKNPRYIWIINQRGKMNIHKEVYPDSGRLGKTIPEKKMIRRK